MSWFDRFLSWVTDHSFSLVLIVCPAALAVLLYYLAFNRFLKAAMIDHRVLLSTKNTHATSNPVVPPPFQLTPNPDTANGSPSRQSPPPSTASPPESLS
jgi:hypothetical protein